MLPGHLAVVAKVDNDRVFLKLRTVDDGEQASDVFVGQGNEGEVAGEGSAGELLGQRVVVVEEVAELTNGRVLVGECLIAQVG